MRAAESRPTGPRPTGPSHAAPADENRSAGYWRRLATSYRQLASGHRLVLDGKPELGELLASSALHQLRTLGVEAVYSHERDPAGEWPGEAGAQASKDGLAAAVAAVDALADGPGKDLRLRSVALLRDLVRLLDVGDQVLHKFSELLRCNDTPRRTSHAGR